MPHVHESQKGRNHHGPRDHPRDNFCFFAFGLGDLCGGRRALFRRCIAGGVLRAFSSSSSAGILIGRPTQWFQLHDGRGWNFRPFGGAFTIFLKGGQFGNALVARAIRVARVLWIMIHRRGGIFSVECIRGRLRRGLVPVFGGRGRHTELDVVFCRSRVASRQQYKSMVVG